MNDSMILTLVTFIPAAGAIVLMLMPRNDHIIRKVALSVSLLAFAVSIFLPVNFQSGQSGFQLLVARRL